MAGQAVPVVVKVGDIELLVEAVVLPGSQPTSVTDRATKRALDAFDRAQQAVEELAVSTATMIGRMAARGARPDQVEVAFGLKVSAQGDVVVASAAGEAALHVKLIYEAARKQCALPLTWRCRAF